MAEEEETDAWGLPYLSSDQEVGISFALFTLGLILLVSTLAPISRLHDVGPGMLGLLMMATSYFFIVESVRELEEREHFLSRKLGE